MYTYQQPNDKSQKNTININNLTGHYDNILWWEDWESTQ